MEHCGCYKEGSSKDKATCLHLRRIFMRTLYSVLNLVFTLAIAVSTTKKSVVASFIAFGAACMNIGLLLGSWMKDRG